MYVRIYFEYIIKLKRIFLIFFRIFPQFIIGCGDFFRVFFSEYFKKTHKNHKKPLILPVSGQLLDFAPVKHNFENKQNIE